jgi:hypothetical protein
LREFRVWNRLLRRGFGEEYLRLSAGEVFQNIVLSDVDRRLLEWYVNNFDLVRERGLGLYIWGNVGVGKTALAVVLVKEYARWCLSDEHYVWDFGAYYFDLSTFYGRRREMEVWWDADIFVLDEFGRDIIGDDVRDFLLRDVERFIRYRVGRRLPTLLVSNVCPGDIRSRYSEGLASILGVVGDSIDGVAFRSLHLLGTDLRKQMRFSRWQPK